MEDADVERRSIAELIAMVAGRETHDLVVSAGGLDRLARADAFEIARFFAKARDGDARPAARPSALVLRTARALAAAFELGRRVESERAKAPARFGSPADVAAWATPRLAALTHEELWMLGVDARGGLRGARCVARGGLNGAAIRAADPVRAALRVDACAFVLVHNHPSGDPTPSKEDVALTAEVAAAGAVVGVSLLDHVVVAQGGYACVPIEEPGSLPAARRSRRAC
jgi:DNA repair protein RadC